MYAVERLDSYSEVSPSGRGLHVYVRGAIPGGGRRSRNVEAYSERRFFAVTGQHVDGTPHTVNDRRGELDALCRKLFTAAPSRAQVGVGATRTAEQTLAPPQDDETVLRKARAAANRDKFDKLWRGQWHGDYRSQSEADLALCRLLDYWTDRNRVQVDRLFRQSGLMRPKWDEWRGHQTYGQLTISHLEETC
jgi:primase-polymerase (primpol)-like protein